MTDTALPPVPTPAPPPPAVAVKRKRRFGLWGWLAVVVGLAVPAGVLIGAWWAVASPSGTAWLLARLPQVQFVEPQGRLLGDFSAKQMTVWLSGTDRIVIDRPRWEGLSVHSTPDPNTWAAIRAKRLTADRVTVQTTPSGKPFTLPPHLRLPFTLDIGEVKLGELHLPNPNTPVLRALQARVRLGTEGGTQHRVDQLSLRVDPMQLSGHAQIGTDAPMALDLQLSATQVEHTEPVALPTWAKALRADWQAQLNARGPLARFRADLRLRAQGQQLDAEGVIAPAEPWPVPQLEATTRDLDLSALLAQAPTTQLSGSISIVPFSSAGPAKAGERGGALSARGTLSNAQPGPWSSQRLPVRRVVFDLRGHANRPDHFEIASLEVQFASGLREAGLIKGQGHWAAGLFELKTQLTRLQPSVMDPRLPAMNLSGPITLDGVIANTSPSAAQSPTPNTTTRTTTRTPPSTPPNATTHVHATADLSGRLEAAPRDVRVRLDATATPSRIEVKDFRASAGDALASMSGTADRVNSAWALKGQAALVDFDPQPWFPGLPGATWERGPHRLNAKAQWALQWPDSVVAPPGRRALIDRLAAVRGEADAQFTHSVLAGVPLSADLKLSHATPTTPLLATATIDAAGNQLKVEAQLASSSTQGANDRWVLNARAPTVGRLGPLLALAGLEGSRLLDGLTGTLSADTRLSGRWPDLRAQGNATVPSLRAGPLSLNQAQLRWLAGSQRDAPVDVLAEAGDIRWNGQRVDAPRLQLQGTGRDHTLTVQSELHATPPAWVEALQGTTGVSRVGDAHTLARASARGGLDGGFFDSAAGQIHPSAWGWKGQLQLLELRGSQAKAIPWFRTRDVNLELQSGAQARVEVGAGRVELLDAAMRWSRLAWAADTGVQSQQIDIQAELEPLAVAPLLRRLQPEFGWTGDLHMGGRIVVRQAEVFSADIVLERARGDLQVTDDSGTQPLGLTDLRLGLNAQNGIWSITQGLAGKQLGQAAGAIVVRTSPRLAWPEANAPMQGVLDAQVANLGTWSPWVPPGWRLGGQLGITASIAGRFGAPEYTGEMTGSGITVRNLLQGVDINSGELDIVLQGETARIRTFTARAGAGRIELSGDASFGERPRAQLKLIAERFQLLGRVDRRVVASGQTRLQLDRDNTQLDGKLHIDEGLFDFTRSDAPSLGNDVVVVGRTDVEPVASTAPSARARKTTIDLLFNLGDNLRVRGRGIDTGLRGEVRLTNPGGRLAVHGAVNTDEGTYAAYGQKLTIDRGIVSFGGPPENPRLDIEATRPNLDVRVGVLIGGTAQNPRVRLFSSTDMTDTERLSWLLLGRASEGLGSGDTALLQRAALALLAGEGEGVTDQFTKALGIDEVSLSQKDGEVRETVITLGKQLSRRWYVGYERSLTETTGTWQLIYRIAQRFTLRAQSGLDNSLDVIWSWRWE